MPDPHVARTGLLYCAAMFAAGFALGVARSLFVAPLAGEFAAVALEAPVLLAFAWTASGWASERLDIPPRFLDRLLAGGGALAALVLAEAVITMALGRNSLMDYLDSYAKSAVLLGLLAQVAFAFFPALRRLNGQPA